MGMTLIHRPIAIKHFLLSLASTVRRKPFYFNLCIKTVRRSSVFDARSQKQTPRVDQLDSLRLVVTKSFNKDWIPLSSFSLLVHVYRSTRCHQRDLAVIQFARRCTVQKSTATQQKAKRRSLPVPQSTPKLPYRAPLSQHSETELPKLIIRNHSKRWISKRRKRY